MISFSKERLTTKAFLGLYFSKKERKLLVISGFLKLAAGDLEIIPYLCPVVPDLINLDEIFENLKNAGRKNIEIENLKVPEFKEPAFFELENKIKQKAAEIGFTAKFHWNQGSFFEEITYL